MELAKQVSVIIDNAPGTMARIGDALREHGINVRGFAAWGEADHGIVRLICDKPLKALDILEDTGMVAFVRDVLELHPEDRPGQLYTIAQKLQEAGVNIDYAYGATPGNGAGTMFLGVSHPEAAFQALRPA